MTAASSTRESTLLNLIASRFEQQGYEVYREPPSSVLPAFLGGLRPDAIALKGDDRVAIVVLAARRTKTDPRIAQLASKFRGETGWRFAVHYASDTIDIDEGIPNVGRQRIANDLELATQVSEEHSARAGLLLGWAALEAATRSAGVLDERSASRPLSAKSLISALEGMGLVNAEEAVRLRGLADLRNAIAHGDLAREPTPMDIRELTGFARRLLQPIAA